MLRSGNGFSFPTGFAAFLFSDSASRIKIPAYRIKKATDNKKALQQKTVAAAFLNVLPVAQTRTGMLLTIDPVKANLREDC